MATGADKDYGNRLAAWFIANARNLGVLYVIWFPQGVLAARATVEAAVRDPHILDQALGGNLIRLISK
ncbi:MAG: hypothetical protein JWP76_4297 [Dactylosporangium sp.]|nr:hypothetical protein [Dactylosporangium sp.]